MRAQNLVDDYVVQLITYIPSRRTICIFKCINLFYHEVMMWRNFQNLISAIFFVICSVCYSGEGFLHRSITTTLSLRHEAACSRNFVEKYTVGRDSSTSVDFAMDPSSSEAGRILDQLGISKEQRSKLQDLATLVVDWNDKINLVSRKDCNIPVVFGRHILPCLAPLGLENSTILRRDVDNQRVVDVGTGGGFPGLPLAIAYPNIQFLLVDSVGKKLVAVQDMADQLGLQNLRTHHGRAEEMVELSGSFHACVGRSVAAIPKYCGWIQDLLTEDGHLLYMIGGDLDPELLHQTIIDVDIDKLLGHPGASDKRILVFPRSNVLKIAADYGEVALGTPNKENKNTKTNSKVIRKKKARGAWEKKVWDAPKERGFENFQRYDSIL